ncbi:MAG: hypothetical protein ACYDEO_29355, partial [Aggregatilineales bacterium]
GRALALNASLSSAPPSSITLLTSSGSPPNLRPQIRMHPFSTYSLQFAAETAYNDERSIGIKRGAVLSVQLRQTQASGYWTENFQIESADLDHIFSLFLEKETPLTNRELAMSIIEFRLRQEEERLRRLIERGQLFQPKTAYATGQELVFPAMNYTPGTVVEERPGYNPEYGDFKVITVEMADQSRHEFASDLHVYHRLNLDGETEASDQRPADAHAADAVFAQHGEEIIEAIEARLINVEDAVYFGGRWFLRSLMATVQISDLHLTEAVLDMGGGGPLPTADLLKELDVPQNVPQLVREFSLDIALNGDDRFDEVGPSGKTWWFLRRLEPAEVTKTPERLVYVPITYDPSALTPELRAIEAELDDEYSDLPPAPNRHEATLTLIYPHRRVGTLPLTSRVQVLFPTAREATRIRVTLVDGQTGNEFPGWVVRDKRYVVGLDQFYRQYRLPIGAYLTIRQDDDPSRLILDFKGHRAHSEYIRLITPANNRLTFANFKRAIGAEYDAFLIMGAEDVEGVDGVAAAMLRDRRKNLPDLMRELMIELAKLNPQNAVHAKTIYSAVNVVRRCPPGPIFAALASRPEFEHVAGPNWRVAN